MAIESIKEKHEKFLYSTVRVLGEKGIGSGTILACLPAAEEGEYDTFVLTNFHVIDGNVTYRKDWDSVLKREIQKEFLKQAQVEVFQYVRMSTVDSSNKYRADVIAYDKIHDLALLKLETPRKFDYVAKLIPEENIKDLRLFQKVVVSGCSLAHEPFCNFGDITFLNEIIEQKKYLMTNASSVFGNSGGTLYDADTGYMIGVPSRITGIQLGFGFDVMTWMGFSCHPERLYEFFKEQECQFIYDPKDSYKAGMDRRNKKKEEGLLEIKAELASG